MTKNPDRNWSHYEAAGDPDAENDAPRWAYITAAVAALVVGLAVPAGIVIMAGAACGAVQAETGFRIDTNLVAMPITTVALLCGFLAARTTVRWIMSPAGALQMIQSKGYTK